jgi:hypothetical protein
MEKNVYMSYGSNKALNSINKMIPTTKGKAFEFNDEKRKRISSEAKEAFGFSHGGKSSYKKKKKKK